jgi:uncharacterized protein YacL
LLKHATNHTQQRWHSLAERTLNLKKEIVETENKSDKRTLINGIGFNIIAIFIGIIIALIVASNTSSNMPASSNHGAIFPFFNAVLFGIITLIAYFSFKNVLKNYSWIITLIGILIMIFASTKI